MKSASWLIPLLALAALLLAPAASGADVEIRLHGSNTLGSKFGPGLLEAYAQANGFLDVKRLQTGPEEFQVTGLDAHGSSFSGTVKAHGTNTGFADLLSNKADVWMASRAASATEVSAARAIGNLHSAEQEHVVALDGLAIAVHPENRVAQISLGKLREAFAGRIVNWTQLGGTDHPIVLYARDAQSGTFDSFKSLVLVDGSAISDTARRFESSSDLEKAIAADPNALGFVGYASITSARALAVFEGPTVPMKPDALSIATEDYLLSRRLYFYTRSDARTEVAKFVEFVLSSAGQKVASEVGFVSQDIFIAKETPPDGNPPAYYDVVKAADRLSLNFRFRPRSSVLDSRALRDIDRLSAFMKTPANKHKQLRLAAFGAHSGDSAPFMVLISVNDRVDYIAQVLVTKGVATRMSRGFVGGTPVAAPSNRPEDGTRNERVEVWLYDPNA